MLNKEVIRGSGHNLVTSKTPTLLCPAPYINILLASMLLEMTEQKKQKKFNEQTEFYFEYFYSFY